MYTFESRVRYSESDESGRLSLEGALNYLQDCSTFQSEDLGMGLSSLREKRRAWWLSSWQIVFHRRPLFGERIRISTWPHGFRGIYGYRNFTIADETGECLVQADSCWFFYDLERRCPARVTQDEIRGYGQGQEALVLPPAPRRIILPQEYTDGEPVAVKRRHLDTNRHVNNAQYVSIARELLPEQFSVRELKAAYKRAAAQGERMYPKIARIQEGYVVSLQDENGTPYANIWMAENGGGGSADAVRAAE